MWYSNYPKKPETLLALETFVAILFQQTYTRRAGKTALIHQSE